VGNAKDQPGGIDGLKNQSGKCERPAGGDRRVKEPEWEMRRIGRGGLDGLKNQSGKCEGPAGGARCPIIRPLSICPVVHANNNLR